MPVLVTAAERSLARRVATRLLEEGGEVRAMADGDVSVLRAAGVFVASGTSDDEGLLEAAAADVHTIVHVGGGLLTGDPASIVRDAEVMLRAAQNAGVRRVIGLSLPGASPDAHDPIRRAKGEVEAHFARSELSTIVIRASLTATPQLLDTLAAAGVGAALRETLIAPVRVEDLLEVVVAFDRARSRTDTGHLVVAADGPQRMSLDAWLLRAGAHGPGRGRLLGRRLPDVARTTQLQATLEGPWWTDDPAVVDGWAFAGVTPGVPIGEPDR